MRDLYVSIAATTISFCTWCLQKYTYTRVQLNALFRILVNNTLLKKKTTKNKEHGHKMKEKERKTITANFNNSIADIAINFYNVMRIHMIRVHD